MKITDVCEYVGTYKTYIDAYIHRFSKTLIVLEKREQLMSVCLKNQQFKKSLTNLLGTEEFERQFLLEVQKRTPFTKVIVGFTDDHPYKDDGFFQYNDGTFTFIGKTEDDVLTNVMYNSFL